MNGFRSIPLDPDIALHRRETRIPHRHAARLQGRPVFTYEVRVRQSGLSRRLWAREWATDVIAHSPADAVNLVRDEIAGLVEHPTEVYTTGPRGGVVSRFVGWESLVGARMFANHGDQPEFSL